jgi:hypothetical protein
VGTGRNFVGAGGLLRKDSNSDLYVVDRPAPFTSGPAAVMKVDPLTGNRTIVSGCIDAGCASIAGSGPALTVPNGGFVRADGSLTWPTPASPQFCASIRSTGNRTVVSGSGVGTGPAFSSGGFNGAPGVGARGGRRQPARDGHRTARCPPVDPATGNRTILSSSTTGSGTNFQAPIGLLLPEPGRALGSAASLAVMAALVRWRRGGARRLR